MSAIEETAGSCLAAVREFADTVLRHGRDVYGSKRTPLLIDGLHVDTLEPATWRKDGETWVLSNLANQQHFFRTLDGLSALTGEAAYRDVAVTATADPYFQAPHDGRGRSRDVEIIYGQRRSGAHAA